VGCGVFFFWEKQLASLRHLFPCQKNTPHPTTDGHFWYWLFCLRRLFFKTVELWCFVGFAGERPISFTTLDWEVLL
jgi:hypothetical protein